jgi:phosphoglycerate dehydrogenase-like enzyme
MAEMQTVHIVLAETTPGHYFEEMTGFFAREWPRVVPDEGFTLREPKTEELGELLAMMPEADFLVIGGAGQRRPVSAEIIVAAPKLRFIQKLGTRHHQIDIQAAARRGIPVAVEPAPSHIAVAEHTFMLMLALARGLFEAHRRVVEGYYEQLGLTPKPTSPTQYAYNWTGVKGIRSLFGKTLGIIGFGDIGAEVAKRAPGLGIKTIYHTRHRLSPEEEEQYAARYVSLEQLLREADFVSLHASHTPETENMINAERLALMRSSAFLINTARGGLVDEAALYDALSRRKIAGAALDVFKQEPTPKDNPLFELDNIIFTPHIAVGSLPIEGRFQGCLDNIARVLRGKKPVGVVNGV